MSVRQEVQEVGLLILCIRQSLTGLALSFSPGHSQGVVNIYLALAIRVINSNNGYLL